MITSETIKSWGLAALSYEEVKLIDAARELFELKMYCKLDDKHGSLFAGCAFDKSAGSLRIVNRGTDGLDYYGNKKSWFRNARIVAGKDGIHNGFASAADDVIEWFFHQICDAESIVISGQSQGSDLSLVEAYFIAKSFPNIRRIHVDAFSCFPAFNQKGADNFKPYLDSGRVTIHRYDAKGDPSRWSIFRDPKSILRDGVDVGLGIELFSVIKFSSTLSLKLIPHSNAVTNSALFQMVSVQARGSISGPEIMENFNNLVMLGKIGERIIN